MIQTNFNPSLLPAQVQAKRLQELPDKTAYNEFTDAVLKSHTYASQADEQGLKLARMVCNVADAIPGSDQRFKILQAGFDAAVSGSLAGVPGGPASLMARLVCESIPLIHESRRDEAAMRTLATIVREAPGTEVAAHAEFALEAGAGARTSKTEIFMNGLSVISELDTHQKFPPDRSV